MSAEDTVGRIDANAMRRTSGMSNPVVQTQGGGSSGGVGPNGKTQGSPYNIQDLRFPTEVAINSANRHWIRFTPCIQQAGSYKATFGDAGSSTVDSNRNRMGTMPGGFQLDFGNVATGLTAINAAESLLAADLGVLKDVAEVADPTLSPSDRANAGAKIAKRATQAVAFGALAATVLKSIDLTRKTRRAASYISLYMPDTVNLTIVNDYNAVSLTQALGKAGIAAAAGESLLGALGVKEGSKLNSGMGGGGFREVIGSLAENSGVFGSGITDVLLFSAGIAQNPQVELIFKTTQNREFLFDFKFVPKTPAEASTVANILKTFRFHAAPEIPKGSGARYFVPPDEFDIEFMYGSQANPRLPKISSCILQGIDVNFASAGQWTTFWDGSPVEMSVQLRFKETEIMHKGLVAEGY